MSKRRKLWSWYWASRSAVTIAFVNNRTGRTFDRIGYTSADAMRFVDYLNSR